MGTQKRDELNATTGGIRGGGRLGLRQSGGIAQLGGLNFSVKIFATIGKRNELNGFTKRDELNATTGGKEGEGGRLGLRQLVGIAQARRFNFLEITSRG